MARDVAAFTLGYYYGEYRQISTQATDRFEMQYNHGGYFESGSPSLYNGNIRHAVYTIAKLHEQGKYEASPEGYAYRYDQLNRLVKMEAYNSGYSYSSFSWTSGSAASILKENVTYDPNGNILTYDRYGNAGSPATIMDSLTYHYTSDKNRLTYIDDAQTNQGAYSGDLEDQTDTGYGNYGYDELGNITRDDVESISNIIWTNAQKIRKIDKTQTAYWFHYNPMQQRVVKREVQNTSGNPEVRTYYMRDAQGNVMATYKAWVHTSGGYVWDSLRLAEHHIYGSARVGIALPDVKLYPEVPENPYIADSVLYTLPEGWKRYELTNHLGNVLAIITDRKRARAASGTDIQWYEADVMAAQQYYPFGMLMPASTDSSLRRQYSLNEYDYRYGFNGKEGDDEIKGDDNQQDYGMRIYDPRVGRFLSVDPIAREFPWYTPYQFAGNKPIWAFDLDGLEDVKWEYSNSDQFIGGQGMSKEDKAVYQEAFDEIVLQGNIAVHSEYILGRAFAWGISKLFGAYTKTANVATKSASQTPKSIAKDLSTTEQTIAKSKQVVKNAENASNVAKEVPALRAAYVKEVEGLSSIASKMRVGGSSSEEIARTLHGLRRELGVKYKSLTPNNLLEKIYQRNLQKYGDKLGPTIDYLRQQGKSWDDIIDSATRTGGKDLGF